jgi:transposase
MREIPENKFLANISKIIDLEKFRPMLDECCKNIGRRADDPVILLKMLFLQRLYNLSDREVATKRTRAIYKAKGYSVNILDFAIEHVERMEEVVGEEIG